MSVLIVAEHRRGAVQDVTFELITAAKELDAPVAVAIVARDPDSLADAVNVDGVDEIITVSVAQQEFESDVYQAALRALLTEKQPKVTLLGFTVNSIGYAAAVAAQLGTGYASDVVALRREEDRLIATRAFYGGKVHADLEFEAGQIVLLLRPRSWEPARELGSASVSNLSLPQVNSRTRHREFLEAASPSDVDITEAEFLLSIGRGIGDRDNIPDLERLAERMGATLAVSRPLVDAGWASSSRQVGQSGKTVKPKVYLALGISGAVQHLAGMKSSGTIIAVNTDSEAAIFNVAHYGAVADLLDVAEELEALY